MSKKEIIRRFHRLHGIDEKEEFMRENNIKFTYDSFYNVVIFADDGVLRLFPVREVK